LIAASLLAACGGGSQTSTLNVFAAASLTDAFKAMAGAYQKQHPDIDIKLNFAGTPTLVTQIEQGAQADVLA